MTGAQLNQISSLHSAYVGLTGLDVKLNAHRIDVWKGWLAEGFEPGDLRLVVKFIKEKIRQGVRREESLRFDLLITPDKYQGFSRFENDLCFAKKTYRVRSDKPVDRVVETPEGKVHFQDHESLPTAQRMSLDLLGESIKALGKQ